MAKKLIYFVRHGQTELNARGIKQGKEGGLNAEGRNQAIETAKKFPKEVGRPQIIISSPFERARETAEIIAKELSLNVEYSDLLVERRNPSEVIGKSKDDHEVKSIVDQIEKSFHDDNWRYSDEENFQDLKARSRNLAKYLKNRPEDRIIVVTHRAFLKIALAYMTRGEELTASMLNTISFFNYLDNATITIVQYISHWFKADEWKLLVWNNTVIEEKNTDR